MQHLTLCQETSSLVCSVLSVAKTLLIMVVCGVLSVTLHVTYEC